MQIIWFAEPLCSALSEKNLTHVETHALMSMQPTDNSDISSPTDNVFNAIIKCSYILDCESEYDRQLSWQLSSTTSTSFQL